MLKWGGGLVAHFAPLPYAMSLKLVCSVCKDTKTCFTQKPYLIK